MRRLLLPPQQHHHLLQRCYSSCPHQAPQAVDAVCSKQPATSSVSSPQQHSSGSSRLAGRAGPLQGTSDGAGAAMTAPSSQAATPQPAASPLPPTLPPSPEYHTECAAADVAALTAAVPSSPPSCYQLPQVEQVPSSHRAGYAGCLEVLRRAAGLLAAGEVVAVPTETVYGLAADARDPGAVGRIFTAKGRPQDNPLIVHISDLDMLQALYPGTPLAQVVPPLYWPLITDLWPGPLTLLLPSSPLLAPAVTAGQPSVAVRMPSHPLARALIHVAGAPLAAPSANLSGRPSPTTAAHVVADLAGRIPLVLDGGPCAQGLESTVLDGLRAPPAVLRPGGVTREQLAAYPGLEQCGVYAVTFRDPALEASPTTPGMKYRHYSPTTPLLLLEPPGDPTRQPHWAHWLEQQLEAAQQQLGGQRVALLVTSAPPGTAVGWAGDPPPPPGGGGASSGVWRYALGSSAEEVGRQLFAALRQLDGCGLALLVVEGLPATGAGLAVMNRLRKAASWVKVME